MYSFGDIIISKALLASRQAANTQFCPPAGRRDAHTQFCPLFKKELRSALRALLVIIGKTHGIVKGAALECEIVGL